MGSSCMFCVLDKCLYRTMIHEAREDCKFMDEQGFCKAQESDLVEYTEEEK